MDIMVKRKAFARAFRNSFSTIVSPRIIAIVEKPDSAKGGDMSTIAPASDLQRILECPICQSVPIPPIYNCAKGHIICGKCRPQLENCCICRENYTDSRNFALEQIVDSSEIVCEFREGGCDMVLAGKDYAKHISTCEFGPVECFQGSLDKCNLTRVDLLSYKEHLIDVHKMSEMYAKSGVLVRQYETKVFDKDIEDLIREGNPSLGSYVNFDGKTFVLRTFPRAGSANFSLVLVGTDADAKLYKVRMAFSPSESSKICFEITMPVRSIRVTNEELSRKYLHVSLTKDMLESFCETDPFVPGYMRTYRYKALQWTLA